MIRLQNVKKSFNKHRSNEIRAIDNTSVTLADVGLVTFLGHSGCGKTTLMNAIGALDKVDRGDIYIDDMRITRRSSGKRDEIRNLNIGYIFQNYNLIEDATVFENVAIALKMIGFKDKKAIELRVMNILERVGIARYRNRPAKMLSGGERQRVGIARAIVKNPRIIIADEPTGNLDSANTIEVMNIIKSISKEKLVILVTHEREIAEFYADRIIEIVDGKIVDDRENDHEGNLDYRVDNAIYLKDMPYVADLSRDGFDVTFYADRPQEMPKINIVVRDGNLFIDTGGQMALGSEGIQIKDESYQGLSKEVYEKYKFDYEEYFDHAEELDPKTAKKSKGRPKRLRYRSIYGFFGSIVGGFSKVHNYSKIKKILLAGFILASGFVMYGISSVAGILNVTDDMFTTTNKDYLTVNTGTMTLAKYQELQKIEGADRIILGDSKVTLSMKLSDYIQTYGTTMDVEGSLSDINTIGSENLIAGRMPGNNYEIVIDRMVAKNIFNNASGKAMGILIYDDILGRTLVVQDYLNEFTIVGISDVMAPNIYAAPSVFNLMILNNPELFGAHQTGQPLGTDAIYPWSYFAESGDVELVRGNAPTNNYEVLIPESQRYEIGIGTAINIKVNGQNLVVSGYYRDKWSGGALYVNDNTFFLSKLESFDTAVIASADKYQVMDTVGAGLNFSVKDNYSEDRQTYLTSVQDAVTRTLLISGVMLAISLIEIYLMLRASFLSRIKEVGVLRAIGVKKGDIYRMFSGEVFAISLLTSIPGIVVVSYILDAVTQIDEFANLFMVNPLTIGLSFLIIFLFNMLAGLLPVFTTMRKTPAAILSRNDVN